MTIEQFKKLNSEELKEYGNELPLGKTYDNNGNILTHKDDNGHWTEYTYDKNRLTYKDNTGYWSESIYDKNGNDLIYKNSKGFWHEYTYDNKGKILTYKDSEGNYEIKGENVSKKEYNKFIKENK